jgi:hypothetical protein
MRKVTKVIVSILDDGSNEEESLYVAGGMTWQGSSCVLKRGVEKCNLVP